jgi:uncharacterized protein YacL
MAVKPAPLNASFMVTAILGLLISVVYVRKLSLTWAFAFSIVFIIMIISALISMVQAPVKGQLMPKFEREIGAKPVRVKISKAKLVKKTKKKSKKKKR